MAEFRELEVFDLITLSATENARAVCLEESLLKTWTEVISFTHLMYEINAFACLLS